MGHLTFTIIGIIFTIVCIIGNQLAWLIIANIVIDIFNIFNIFVLLLRARQ